MRRKLVDTPENAVADAIYSFKKNTISNGMIQSGVGVSEIRNRRAPKRDRKGKKREEKTESNIK